MDEKCYAKSAFIFTIIAFILSLSPIIVPILVSPFEEYANQHVYFAAFFNTLAYFDWTLSIAIAAFAFKRTLRMINNGLRIWLRVISILIIIGSVCFGLFALFGLSAYLLVFNGYSVMFR